MATLNIQSAQGNYNVDFFQDIRLIIDECLKIAGAQFVIDERVGELYSEVLRPLCESRPVYRIPATEQEKTLEGVARLSSWLQETGATKQSTLVAIGGGIIQDISTFTAHSYYRGIPWVFVPTTVLSMCDSCIGAKCGINLGKYKNQLGVFQSPKRVLISNEFARTLVDQDVASGYGEILKLMLTGSANDMKFLEDAISQTGLRNGALLSLIQRSLEVKKGVIEADEYEGDLRRILNYGHTFGHALEAITNHEICHGLAVAWGIDLINFISFKKGLLPEMEFLRIHKFIDRHLPFRLSRAITSDELIFASRRDKKVSGHMVNLVLFAGAGNLRIVKTAFDSLLTEQVTDYLEHWNVYRHN